MAWTSPMTAVTNATWTSAQFNTHIRDNLLETMPGKATAIGQVFSTNGANSIVARTISGDTVATQQTTTSTSYTDLTTMGPAVTVTTGTSAIVWHAVRASNNNSAIQCFASVAVSGATTVAASDDWAIIVDGYTANNDIRIMSAHHFTGLTAGSNTFTLKYRVQTTTGRFSDRHIAVWPL